MEWLGWVGAIGVGVVAWRVGRWLRWMNRIIKGDMDRVIGKGMRKITPGERARNGFNVEVYGEERWPEGWEGK